MGELKIEEITADKSGWLHGGHDINSILRQIGFFLGWKEKKEHFIQVQ